MIVIDREQLVLASRELVGEQTWRCPHSHCRQVILMFRMMSMMIDLGDVDVLTLRDLDDLGGFGDLKKKRFCPDLRYE